MIKENIIISQDSYNLENWKKALLERCIMDNPNQEVEYMAKLMGISKGTFERMKSKYNIHLNNSTRKILNYALKNEYI